MPLVRISMIKGRPPNDVRAIVDGVQRALAETYKVPSDDRFQIVEQLDREALIYDPGYLGISRTDGLVFIHIFAGHWRDTSMKKALYARIAALLSERPGVRPEDVQVVITSNDRPDWSFGKGLASYVPDDAGDAA